MVTTTARKPKKDQEKALQRKQEPATQVNQTGIPTQMKEDFEDRSGLSFDDVRVYYNSTKPAQLQTLAYTQGNQIHIATGQEGNLGHELEHVVQQKQGRVKPTMRLRGVDISDDEGLESEAISLADTPILQAVTRSGAHAMSNVVQLKPRTVRVNEYMEQEAEDYTTGKMTKHGWRCNFDIVLPTKKNDDQHVEILIRIDTDADQVYFNEWAELTKNKLGGFELKGINGSLPIFVILTKVDANFVNSENKKKNKDRSYYKIKANNGPGKRGQKGTESMLEWGTSDDTQIPHEVMHMLGNLDEYGKVNVNGVTNDYGYYDPAKGELADSSGNRSSSTGADKENIMLHGALPVLERHFDFVLKRIKAAKIRYLGDSKNLKIVRQSPQTPTVLQPGTQQVKPQQTSVQQPAIPVTTAKQQRQTVSTLQQPATRPVVKPATGLAPGKPVTVPTTGKLVTVPTTGKLATGPAPGKPVTGPQTVPQQGQKSSSPARRSPTGPQTVPQSEQPQINASEVTKIREGLKKVKKGI